MTDDPRVIAAEAQAALDDWTSTMRGSEQRCLYAAPNLVRRLATALTAALDRIDTLTAPKQPMGKDLADAIIDALEAKDAEIARLRASIAAPVDDARVREIEGRVCEADMGALAIEDTRSGLRLTHEHQAPGVGWHYSADHAVWDCDDEEDGCPGYRRNVHAQAELFTHAPADLAYLLARVRDLVSAATPPPLHAP